jgi:toxin ParE1/3/4
MMRVIWSPLAAEDLDRIAAYIAQFNPVAARAVAKRIYEGCGALGQFPYGHRKSRIPGKHDLVFTNLPYIAVYRVGVDRVEIIRIYHSAQDWP